MRKKGIRPEAYGADLMNAGCFECQGKRRAFELATRSHLPIYVGNKDITSGGGDLMVAGKSGSCRRRRQS